MEKALITLPELALMGITARTKNVLEMNPATAKIGPTVQRYIQGALGQKIPHRKRSGVTYCAYTAYESDFTDYYTYFIGEEVTSVDHIPEGFTSLIIPAQTYAKFTNKPGPMPQVCIEMWQKIWALPPNELGGERKYTTDFEVYDERAINLNHAVLDIYIGLKE